MKQLSFDVLEFKHKCEPNSRNRNVDESKIENSKNINEIEID